MKVERIRERVLTPISSTLDSIKSTSARHPNSVAIVLITLATGVVLRTYRLSEWFNRVHDYDEGAWSLAARELAAGRQLYGEIFFVHPPLYELVLAVIYGIFGYSFMIGRWASIVFSTGTAILIGITAYRLTGRYAAVVAFVLYMLNPITVFFGRRAVQEPLGSLFVATSLLTVSLAITRSDESVRRYALAGVPLGLALATKYIFAPAVFGVGLGLLVLGLVELRDGLGWRTLLRRLGSIVGTTIVGFAVVTAYYWIRYPERFVRQTVLIHLNRSGTGSFPALFDSFQSFLSVNHWIRWMYTPLFLSLVVLVAVLVPQLRRLYNDREHSRVRLFVGVSLFGALSLGQFLSFLPRYWVATYLFMPVAFSVFFPEDTAARLSDGTLDDWAPSISVGLIVLILCIISLPIPFQLMGYDVVWPVEQGGEDEGYAEVTDWLESHGADIVYSTNPTITARTDKVRAIDDYETFAGLYLRGMTPESYAERIIRDDPDYILIDPWARSWAGEFQRTNNNFIIKIKKESKLITQVKLEDGSSIRIYDLLGKTTSIFNSNLSGGTGGVDGWQVERGGSEGSITTRSYTELTVHKGSTTSSEQWEHIGLSQRITYPENSLYVRAKTNASTSLSTYTTVESGVQFTDGDNRLIFGFSNQTDEVRTFERTGWRLVVLPTNGENRWTVHELPVDEYWSAAGWAEPDTLSMEVYVAAHTDAPGRYSLSISRIGTAGTVPANWTNSSATQSRPTVASENRVTHVDDGQTVATTAGRLVDDSAVRPSALYADS